MSEIAAREIAAAVLAYENALDAIARLGNPGECEAMVEARRIAREALPCTTEPMPPQPEPQEKFPDEPQSGFEPTPPRPPREDVSFGLKSIGGAGTLRVRPYRNLAGAWDFDIEYLSGTEFKVVHSFPGRDVRALTDWLGNAFDMEVVSDPIESLRRALVEGNIDKARKWIGTVSGKDRP